MSEPIRMTDKKETKELPCAVCGVALLVTKFLKPEKARCPEHKGNVSMADRSLIETKAAEDKPSTPNRALSNLRCPIDDHPLKLKGVDKAGFLAFHCINSYCACVVEIKPNWGAMMMDKITPEWQDFATQFNALQKEQYLFEQSHTPIDPNATPMVVPVVVPDEGQEGH